MRNLTTLILFVLMQTLGAQSQFTVRHYSMEDGLSHNMIQNIQQDSQGYIWLSTWNGIEKFDGYTFRNFKSYLTDEIKLGNNRIEYLLKSSCDNIWVNTYGQSTHLFHSKTEKFVDVFSGMYTGLIRAVYPLNDGITWAVTEYGDLYRIDENHYTEPDSIRFYGKANNPYIGDIVYTVYQDSDKNEWILTNKGITIAGTKKIANNMPFEYILEVNGTIYLASSNGYLASYNSRGQITPLVLPTEIKEINGLKLLPDGKFAILLSKGMLIYDTVQNNTRSFFFKDKTGDISVENPYLAGNGVLWMFTNQRKIVYCNPKTGENKTIPYPDLSHVQTIKGTIQCFHEDEQGEIWVLLKEGVLCYYNAEREKLELAYYEKDSEKKVYTIAARNFLSDTHKNLWVNTKEGFDYISFRKKDYERIVTSRNQEVRGLMIDEYDRLWMGIKNNKIEIYDKDYQYLGNLSSEGRIIRDPSIIFGAGIYCFYQDQHYNIWMGSKDQGLYLLQPQTSSSYNIVRFMPNPSDEYSISSKSIYSIYQDSYGRMWIGSYGGGINLIEKDKEENVRFIHSGNRLKNYPFANCSHVRCIYETKEGIIMVGNTGGLLTFPVTFNRPEEISFFHNFCEANRSDCLSNNDIMSIHQHHTGNIYISTFSGGIDLVEAPGKLLTEQIKFKNYNRTNGLTSDLSLSIIEDEKGTMWITSAQAVCKFDAETKTFNNFSRNNLKTPFELTEATPVSDHRGGLILGTTNGALRILTNKIEKSNFIPPIVFTKIRTQSNKGENEQQNSNMFTPILSPDERNITISFAALDYTDPSNIQYSYRLEGVSERWTYIDKNRSAGFVNLPAGEYVFQVKSTNADGVWVDNITSLPILVPPTFWETGWAWLLYILAFLAIGVIIVMIIFYIFNLRRRVDFEQQITQLKLKFFTDISHELRTPLTLIASPIDEVINNEPLSETAKENMYAVKRNTDRMLRLINQILDFRKIQNNKMKVYLEQTDVIAITRRVFDNFSTIAHQRKINYQYQSNTDQHEMYTDIDKLEKILFNLLSNAFKYTIDGKNICLTVSTTKNELRIEVKDEGTGFDIRRIDQLFSRFETANNSNPKISSGIGLSLVKELVNLMHGRIQVESTKGKGSTFSIQLPGNYDCFSEDPTIEFILNDRSKPGAEQQLSENPVGLQPHETTILVIEDNEELRHFIRNILYKEYRVLEAENGKQGLEITRKELPDIVVSDIMMPEMDGIEYLNVVKKDHDICHIPIILLTAKSSMEDCIKGMQEGADDYITKPFNSIYLKAKILSLLKQRELLREYYLSDNKGTTVIADSSASDSTEIEQKRSLLKITPYDNEFISRVIESIEENIDNTEFKIEDLSNAMCMSRAVFYRKIKSIVGLSPIDFVKKLRVKRAAQLLATEHLTIAEVAYRSGFTTPQYLSKVFKEIMACSPTEYRQRCLESDFSHEIE